MMWKSAHRVLRDIRHRRHFLEPNWKAGISRYWPVVSSSSSNSSSSSSNSTRNGDDQKQQVLGWESVGRHLQCNDWGSGREAAHQGWSRSSSTLPSVGYHGPKCTMSGWSSSRSGIVPDGKVSSLPLWKNGEILRVLSTKSTPDSDDTQKSSNPPEDRKGAEPTTTAARPKSIEDFQHEEIVGPTVERDMSDLANQLRSSLTGLTAFMTNLRNGLVLLGSVQLLAAIWSADFHGVGLIHGLPQNLAFVVSFALAYLLRYYASALVFFRRVEERSRMKILTLSLQVAKMLSLFFYRSDFVVKAVAFGSLVALTADIWQSHFGG